MYEVLAPYYDLFMEEIDPNQWAEYLLEIIGGEGPVLDLGCGTGRITRELARHLEVTGVDASPAMLAQLDSEIPRFCGDLRTMDLPQGKYRAAVSSLDVLNHIPPVDWPEVFHVVSRALQPGGLFTFDIQTPYRLAEVLGDGVAAEVRPEASYIWESRYDPSAGALDITLTLFVREGELYRKLTGEVREWGVEISQLRELAQAAGFTWKGAYQSLTFTPPRADTERIQVLLVKT